MNRKAQFGTYLKPVMVIIFGILLIIALRGFLQTRTSLEQGEVSVDLHQQARKNFQKIAECLNVNKTVSGSKYLLDISLLEEYNQTYQRREPECAEDFRYGYTVSVRSDCVANPDLNERYSECGGSIASFGETEGSTGKSLGSSASISFPVAVKKDDYTTLPALMSITVRNGDLEQLAGAINRVIEQGGNTRSLQTGSLTIVNEQALCSGDECTSQRPSRPDTVCLDSANNFNCVVVRADSVQPFNLRPGRHVLKIQYNPQDSEVRIVE